MADQQPVPDGGKPLPAVRFLFKYDQSKVSLVSQQPLMMLVPPSDPLQGFEGLAGFWYELRDNTGRAIYRRVVHNPIQHHVEVHEEGAASPRRRLVDIPSGVFTIVVPDLPEAQTLALCSSPFSKSYGPVADLATFLLHASA